MKTVLVCHHDDDLNREALARWLASFSNLTGLVVIEETRQQKRRRIKREIQRVGRLRFLDVLAYRIYHRIRLHHIDLVYERGLMSSIAASYPPLPSDLPILVTNNANSSETKSFLDRLQPDLMIARCKVILKPAIFESARLGTYVMHPGIRPKYRNAHGCFWALAEGDLQNVGMTLLKVDKGVDTGPVYGYFSYPYDEIAESHIVIQHRVVFDNLDRIRDKFIEIEKGTASAIDTRGHSSGTWGQPWLTRYFRWKAAAKRRARNMNPISLLYHDVVNGDPAASGFRSADADIYKLNEADFRAHLDKLGTLNPKSIVLTFDDGGVSADRPTATLLEAYGLRGHFFIVTERIDQPGFLTRAQIRDLQRRGHTIGSHSHSHPACFTDLTYAEMVQQWKESRRILTDILGNPPVSVSVPGGFYSKDVARAALEAGYRILFNSEPTSRTNQLAGLSIHGRYGIKHDTTAEQVQALARGDVLPRATQALVWNIKKPLKKAGGPVWFTFRRWFFSRS